MIGPSIEPEMPMGSFPLSATLNNVLFTCGLEGDSCVWLICSTVTLPNLVDFPWGK
ncbi:unnamed protein product [Meloidogyne enterolobii]|uniref:Uncharacterized protein n=1 Tax=Meloidogyne enterolobii TaxID=390850 RepID=A0ACB0XNS3_MELEN